MRKFLGLALPLLAALGLATVAAPSASAAQCGWYKEGGVGYHQNCGPDFILIKVHYSNGSTDGECQGPWSTTRLGSAATNAYYVPIAPWTGINSAGKRICHISQPPV